MLIPSVSSHMIFDKSHADLLLVSIAHGMPANLRKPVLNILTKQLLTFLVVGVPCAVGKCTSIPSTCCLGAAYG